MDGRIKIVLNDENDLSFFAELLQDAVGEGTAESLVDQIAGEGADEDWKEYVKPDLITQFKQEAIWVANALADVQEEEEKEFFIDTENARNWYSTFNQARLNLENGYNLSEMPDDPSPENCEMDLLKARIRSDIYMQIQSLVLETMDI